MRRVGRGIRGDRARAALRRSPEKSPSAGTPGSRAGETAIAVTDATLGELLRQTRVPVLLEFASAWSEASRAVSRQVALLAQRHRRRLCVLRADSADCPEWAARLRIVGTPAVLLVYRGREYGRVVGTSRPQSLERAVARLLELAAPAAVHRRAG